MPIHYRGGGPAMQDLISGQVQVMLIQGGGAIQQYIRSGRLVALGVSTAERSRFYPELPPIAETYPGFASESWVGMFAPAATPRAVVDTLNSTLKRFLSDPRVKDRLEAQNCDLVGGTPGELAAVVRSDQAKWSRIIRAQHITVE